MSRRRTCARIAQILSDGRWHNATPLPFARWLVELAAASQRRQGVA